MNKREIVRAVYEGKKPPYVPWSFGFTVEAQDKLLEHFRGVDFEDALDNHILSLGNGIGFFEELGDNRVRDVFGVVWDRSVDKDIGIVEGSVTTPHEIERIKEIAKNNVEMAAGLHSAMDVMSNQAGVLNREIEKFKL